MDQEDGTLRLCIVCAEETPHQKVQTGDEIEWACEFCMQQYKRRYAERFDLPVIKLD